VHVRSVQFLLKQWSANVAPWADSDCELSSDRADLGGMNDVFLYMTTYKTDIFHQSSGKNECDCMCCWVLHDV
jgi:hypothetical protein